MFEVKSHLIDLKGKAYLQVMWRLVWFREDHPDWNIDTKLEHYDASTQHAIFSAKIYDSNGVQKSAGYGSESVKDFKDYIEKAETKAVGRALAMLGYGTQFAPELDEGDRIVDSPVPVGAPNEAKIETPQDAANYVLTFGKYNGKTLWQVWQTDRQYIDWMFNSEKTDPIVKRAIITLSKAVSGNG